MTTNDAVTSVPAEVPVARSRMPWLRTALVVLVVMLVVALVLVTAISGLAADPMAGT